MQDKCPLKLEDQIAQLIEDRSQSRNESDRYCQTRHFPMRNELKLGIDPIQVWKGELKQKLP